MGTTRVVYNRALSHIRDQEKTEIDTKKLQSLYVTRKSRDGIINDKIEDWQFETPKDIRNGAIRDLKKAFKTAFTHLKRGLIQKFKVGFKRKKTYPSVEIPRKALSFKNGKLRLYPTYDLQPLKLSRREKKIDLEYDCRLQYIHGHYYLVVPYKKKSKPKQTSQSKGILSLDPGVRTFLTGYSENEVIKIQHNRETLKKLQHRLDHFKSLRYRKLIRRSSFSRRQKSLYRKVKNIITELHYTTIQVLKDYKWILLPAFESQEMVGRLHRKTNRELLGLQHYLFKQRLKASLKLDSYSNVIDVTEEYTSKTCGQCGSLKKIGGSETYKCSNCGLVIDRDVNGARNILLKHLYS